MIIAGALLIGSDAVTPPVTPDPPNVTIPGAQQVSWYNPYDMTKLFQDTGGSTPVTASGQNVNRVNDGFGNYNLIAQTNPLTYVEVDDYKYINSSGTGHLEVSTVDLEPNCTIVILAEMPPAGTVNCILSYDGPSGDFQIQSEASGQFQYLVNTSGMGVDGPDMDDYADELHYFTFKFNDDTSEIIVRVDGVEVGVMGGYNGAMSTPGTLRFFANRSGGALVAGKLHGAIIWNGLGNVADVEAWADYTLNGGTTPPDPGHTLDGTAVIDEVLTARFGMNWLGTNNISDDLVQIEFAADGTKDLKLTVDLYDVDYVGEVEVFINDVSIGTGTVNSSAAVSNEFLMDAADIINGTNVLEFRQDGGNAAWGVQNILIEVQGSGETPIGVATNQATLNSLLNSAVDGDLIHLSNANFGNWSRTNVNKDVRIESQNQASMATFTSVTLNNCRQLKIGYVKVNGTSDGFSISNGQDVTIHHCDVRNSFKGIKVNSHANITVEWNVIRDCVEDGSSFNNITGGNIRFNDIQNMDTDGGAHHDGIQFHANNGPSSNVNIYNNYIRTGDMNTQQLYMGSNVNANNFNVYNNVFVGGHQWGLTALHKMTNSSITNNTVIRGSWVTGSAGVNIPRIDIRSDSTGMTCTGNIAHTINCPNKGANTIVAVGYPDPGPPF